MPLSHFTSEHTVSGSSNAAPSAAAASTTMVFVDKHYETFAGESCASVSTVRGTVCGSSRLLNRGGAPIQTGGSGATVSGG